MNHDGPVEYQKRWPQFTNSEQKHLGLNSESVKIHKGLRNQMCAFWNRFLPRLLNITGEQKVQCSKSPVPGRGHFFQQMALLHFKLHTVISQQN